MGDAYRHGKVHVMAERCETCVFRPGNLMRLSKGRLADLIAQNRKADSGLTCHETLDGYNAICRGFFDLEPKTTPLQLAERVDMIAWVT